MTDSEHPFTRALRLIEALTVLVTEKERENAILRATFESRLERLAETRSAAAPLLSLNGRRRNRSAQVLALLERANGPLRCVDVARQVDLDNASTHTVLATLCRARRVRQLDDKRWEIVTQENAMPTTLPRFAAIGGAVLLLSLLSSVPSLAQTPTPTVNPTKVIFEPSPNHSATEPITGQPMVSKYVLQIHAIGAQTPITEVDLGKPDPLTALDPSTPGARIGEIVAKPTELLSLPVGVRYFATVTAVGVNGLLSGPSNSSDPFGRAAPPAAPPGAPRLTR